MASAAIESDAALKAASDMDLNNSDPGRVTPGRTRDEPGSTLTPGPPTSGASGGEYDGEESQNSTASPAENGDEALEERPAEARAAPQGRTSPDSEHRQPGARSSSPKVFVSGSTNTVVYVLNASNGALYSRDKDTTISIHYVMDHGKKPKKKLAAPNISLTFDRSEGSLLSDELDESTELDLDDIDTPSDNSNEFEWEDDLPKPKTTELLQKGMESVQEYSASEEREEGRRWRVFRFGDQEHRVDMKAIEPYKRVISHGGYYGDGLNAIIVFAVCFMPESNQPNYRYIMDNLFKYVIGTLELLVAENYMIVYLNGATSRKKMPTVGWLRKCYQQIDRRLRKNLKSLIIVHPSWFIRTLLALTKPFISSKFSQKIQYVYSLTDLGGLVPMEYVSIPDCIKQFDDEKNRKSRKRIDQDMHGKVEIAAAAVPE
ncbi:hypothetical protein F2P81_006993 [Scophthalmus maximus]|uniref:CRAL-TRIO domain-containing protein n=1 Tax=Scophthalmus maximus TaxID=52904 RepID=A0A6A4T7G2_SCOMX|nr:hypothetical protein F2P81_006993 [Scophthalmus maximus]